jgi:hypothetical protein
LVANVDLRPLRVLLVEDSEDEAYRDPALLEEVLVDRLDGDHTRSSGAGRA